MSVGSREGAVGIATSPRGDCDSRRTLEYLYLPVFLLHKLGNAIIIFIVFFISQNVAICPKTFSSSIDR